MPAGLSPKKLGLFAAALLGTIFVVVIGVSVLMAPKTTPVSNNDVFPEDPGDFIDIEDTQSGGAMLVTMVDKDDPTRIAGTLEAERFEPIGEGRRRLDKPESWIYLKDGRAVKITADFATVLMPDPNQPPESGTLEGNIRIESYDQSPPASGSDEPSAPPTLTARFDDPVEFERRYLRLSSPGRFEINSQRVDFVGSDLTVILNDLRNRIELLDVAQGQTITIRSPQPGQRVSDTQPTASSSSVQNPLPPSSEQQPPAEPSTDRVASAGENTTSTGSTQPAQADQVNYHIVMNDRVNAALGSSGSAQADILELWVSLIDGKIPQDAIRKITLASAAHAQEQTGSASPTATPPTETPQTTTEPTPAPSPIVSEPNTPTPEQLGDDQPLIITWDGRLTVRPIDDRVPDQLLEDKVALRLSAHEGKGITFSAPDRGFTGQAVSATYSATRAVLDLRGKESEAEIVRLEVEDAGTLLTPSLSADLNTGLVSIQRRGQITATPGGSDDPEDLASVQWKNKAQFQFAIIENQLTQRLSHARFEGAAIAKQAGNSVGARILEARLNPDLPPRLALNKLTLTDGVLAGANKSMFSGKAVEIDFVPTPDLSGIDPVWIVADGQAMGRTTEAMLQAEHMDATLMRTLDDRISVRTARATGQVRYRASDRTSAHAEQLDADGLNEVIVLTGPDSSVSQGGSSISGNHITLRAKRRAIEVLGAGTFEHDIALNESEAPDSPSGMPMPGGHIRASWKGSMAFDDTIGTLTCQQDVLVISTPDALTRDTLKADRVVINLTPMPSADPVAGARSPERQLLSARASGIAKPGQDPIPASIETRSYSPQDPELALGVMYLEGAQILADNIKQTLRVPSPGTLLVLDRDGSSDSDQDQTEANDGQPAIASSGPGLTRFTWAGGMELDRAAGNAQFNRDVRIDQKSLETNKIARLSASTVAAHFDIEESSDENEALRSDGLRLKSATASGGVRFLYEGRELLCDEGIYDAAGDSLFARGIDDKLVTLYDSSSPTPTSAKTMSWDLTKDQIKINAPSPFRSNTGG